MAQRKKAIALSAALGAVAGGLGAIVAKRFGPHLLSVAPAFRLDPVSIAHHRYIFAAIPWIVFSFYWEHAAKNAAPAKSAETIASRRLHVSLTNLALLLEIVPIRGLGRFLPATALTLLFGIAVEAAGLFLAIWARRVLGRNWSGEISIKVEHELIRSGPYRRLRHPIYTGILAMYVGAAVITGLWLAAVGVGVATLAYWRKIRLEEVNLVTAFGAGYDEYRRETWALVPGVF